MLRGPGLSHELPHWKPSCPADHPGIGSASLAGLTRLILDGPAAFESTYVFSLLRSSLNLFPDKDKGCHCLNGSPEEQAAGVLIGAFAIGREGFLFRVQVVTPENTRKSLRHKLSTVIFLIQLNPGPAVNLDIVLCQPFLWVLTERRDQRAIRRSLNEYW